VENNAVLRKPVCGTTIHQLLSTNDYVGFRHFAAHCSPIDITLDSCHVLSLLR
jgi:hypothetical protein